MRIDSLEIDGFRGIHNLRLEGLAPLNVLVGQNGAGKTSVLEARLLLGRPSGGSLSFVARHRERDPNTAIDLRTLFKEESVIGSGDKRRQVYARAEGIGVFLTCEEANGTTFQGTEQAYDLNGSPTLYMDQYSGLRYIGIDHGRGESLEEAISLAERQGRRKAVLDLLRGVSPHINDLRLIVENGNISAYVEESDADGTLTLWPASAAGDGVKRLLLLACYAANSKGDTVIIEDPEAFQHQRSIRQIVKLLRTLSAGKGQVFMATHSIDFIRALIADVNGTENDDVAVFHLQRDRGKVQAKRYTGTQMQALRVERKLRDELGFV